MTKIEGKRASKRVAIYLRVSTVERLSKRPRINAENCTRSPNATAGL
jgi:hypothetical protein